MNLRPLAQHAFIKSINLESNNPVAWTNLGFLHYQAKSYTHAHHCFGRAQTIDPSYSYCWAGEVGVLNLIEFKDFFLIFATFTTVIHLLSFSP